MPVRVTRNRDGTFRVTTPGGIKAKRTTKKKAEAQARIIREADKRR